MKSIIGILMIGLVCIAVASLVSRPALGDTGTVIVTVCDETGRVAPGAIIEVMDLSEEQREWQEIDRTDENGQLQFDLEEGFWRIRARRGTKKAAMNKYVEASQTNYVNLKFEGRQAVMMYPAKSAFPIDFIEKDGIINEARALVNVLVEIDDHDRGVMGKMQSLTFGVKLHGLDRPIFGYGSLIGVARLTEKGIGMNGTGEGKKRAQTFVMYLRLDFQLKEYPEELMEKYINGQGLRIMLKILDKKGNVVAETKVPVFAPKLMRQKAKHIQEVLEDLKKKIDLFRRDIHDFEKRLKAVEKTARTNEGEIEELKEDLEDLEYRIEELEADVTPFPTM